MPDAVLEDDHVPPAVVQDSVVVCPLQIVEVPVIGATDGVVITVIVSIAVLLQPLVSIPVTVYVVVTVGDAVTDPPVVADNPVAGVQL